MYEDFYNLSDKPFELSPDPDFFYGSRGHARAMAYLEYGVDQGEGFIVITGEVGAGKTTLVNNLFRALDGDRVVAAQLVSTRLNADDLLRAVCRAFGLNPKGPKSDLLIALERYLRDCRGAGKRCLLIIDEAQNLTDMALEELRMLTNFQTEAGCLLQSFLVGQPEFRETLRSPALQQLRQRVIASYHLGPMDRDETQQYIEHRLQRVGWQNDPVLSDDAYDALHTYTGGVPRRINTVCDRLLLFAFLEERHRIDQQVVRTVTDELDRDLGDQAAEAGETVDSASPPPAEGVETAAATEGATLEQRLASLDKRLARLERQQISNAAIIREILECLRAPS